MASKKCEQLGFLIFLCLSLRSAASRVPKASNVAHSEPTVNPHTFDSTLKRNKVDGANMALSEPIHPPINDFTLKNTRAEEAYMSPGKPFTSPQVSGVAHIEPVTPTLGEVYMALAPTIAGEPKPPSYEGNETEDGRLEETPTPATSDEVPEMEITTVQAK